MRIDKGLFLAIPIYDDDEGQTVHAWVHSTPLSREAVERHVRILGPVHSAIYSQGYGQVAGPAAAMMLLKKHAEDTGQIDGPAGVGALIAEIKRTTTVLVPGEPGQAWTPVPIDAAVQRSFITDDDRAEVENAIAFFICGSALLPRAMRRAMLDGGVGLWGAQISPLDSTAFAASLRTLSATANSGERSPASAPSAAVSANATVDGKPALLPH